MALQHAFDGAVGVENFRKSGIRLSLQIARLPRRLVGNRKPESSYDCER